MASIHSEGLWAAIIATSNALLVHRSGELGIPQLSKILLPCVAPIDWGVGFSRLPAATWELELDPHRNVQSGYKLHDTFYEIWILDPSRTQATLLVQFSNVTAYRRVSRSSEWEHQWASASHVRLGLENDAWAPLPILRRAASSLPLTSDEHHLSRGAQGYHYTLARFLLTILHLEPSVATPATVR